MYILFLLLPGIFPIEPIITVAWSRNNQGTSDATVSPDSKKAALGGLAARLRSRYQIITRSFGAKYILSPGLTLNAS